MKDYYSFACTSIGFSHISSKKPCQDYSLHFQNDTASVIIVSDGHGSSNFTRSDRGSKFACEVSAEAVNEFLRDIDVCNLEDESLRDSVVAQLCKYILLKWNQRIDEDVSIHPFTEDEVEKVADKYRTKYLHREAVEHAYGCTLLIAIITKDYYLAIRNGDGQCVSVDRSGCFCTPIPWNDNCEFNVTTSLCDNEAIENFRYYYSSDLPAAIFIGSDGVDDSYSSIEELYNLYRNICLKALHEGTDVIPEYLEMLLPEITKRGSTDDVSIAGLINTSSLTDAQTTMEIAIELREHQMEEARRAQQKRILLRDIKMAEKKRSKAIAQRQEVRQQLQSLKGNRASILEQISIFRHKAVDYAKRISALVLDESQFTDVIAGADSEITRLTNELLALDEVKKATNVTDAGSSMAIEVVDEAVSSIDCLSGHEADTAIEPETIDDIPQEIISLLQVDWESGEDME